MTSFFQQYSQNRMSENWSSTGHGVKMMARILKGQYLKDSQRPYLGSTPFESGQRLLALDWAEGLPRLAATGGRVEARTLGRGAGASVTADAVLAAASLPPIGA